MSTSIEWTDETWNPVTGCTKVSPGCDHCYAKTMHERFNGPDSFDTVTMNPDRLDIPLRWRKPRKVFVNSMSDLFHGDIPAQYIADVFAVMALAPQHTFQILTKRHARMRSLVSGDLYDLMVEAIEERGREARGLRWPLSNVWLGVSVEDQRWADVRIPELMRTPAAVRFLSCEPLLGPVKLSRHHAHCPVHDFTGGFCTGPCEHLVLPDWVIVGGESGHGARPMQLDWAQSLRDQCLSLGIPFLFKQWGAWTPTPTLSVGALSDRRERHGEIVDDGKHADLTWRRLYRNVGKKAAGRELDGRTWDEYPSDVTP